MGRTQIVAATLALMALPSLALAGAANANLNCKGTHQGAAVTLAGSIPGDFAEFDLSLQFKEQSLAMESEQDRINAVTAFAKGVWVVTVALANGSNLQLYALPKSISYKGSHRAGALKATFKAILAEAPKPFSSSLSGAELSCSYAYAI